MIVAKAALKRLGLVRHHHQHDRGFRLLPPLMMGRRSAKIAGKKGSADSKKSKLYGLYGKQILQAAKAHGPDPANNARLKELLNSARLANVPKDIVERNIQRAADKNQADFDEVTFECYGPGGTGFVMECLTDNNTRSSNQVRNVVTKNGGKWADPGSVIFNFRRQGLIFLRNVDRAHEEAVFDAAIEAGAEDVMPSTSEEGDLDGFKVLTQADDFASVRNALRESQFAVDEDQSGLVFSPLTAVEVDEEAFEQNEVLLERLLATDDVDAVHTNCAGLGH